MYRQWPSSWAKIPHTIWYRSSLVENWVMMGFPTLMWMVRLLVQAAWEASGSQVKWTRTGRREPYRFVWAAAMSSKWRASSREVKNSRSLIFPRLS